MGKKNKNHQKKTQNANKEAAAGKEQDLKLSTADDGKEEIEEAPADAAAQEETAPQQSLEEEQQADQQEQVDQQEQADQQEQSEPVSSDSVLSEAVTEDHAAKSPAYVPPNTEIIIDMININKGYMLGEDKVPVLKNVCFQVHKGEFVAILGPSGSGKTTLMNIVGCMDIADSGEYYLDGKAIHEMEEDELTGVRNEEIGFIFQNYQLIPTYDILQNIIMPLVVRGMNSRDAEEKSMDIIRLLGLDHRLAHKPAELSGGQKQRVSIARALVGEPAILLADEPTGALDSTSGKEVLRLFQRLNDMGNTIVMITHDLNVAKAARRIVHIIDGELTEG